MCFNLLVRRVQNTRRKENDSCFGARARNLKHDSHIKRGVNTYSSNSYLRFAALDLKLKGIWQQSFVHVHNEILVYWVSLRIQIHPTTKVCASLLCMYD